MESKLIKVRAKDNFYMDQSSYLDTGASHYSTGKIFLIKDKVYNVYKDNMFGEDFTINSELSKDHVFSFKDASKYFELIYDNDELNEYKSCLQDSCSKLAEIYNKKLMGLELLSIYIEMFITLEKWRNINEKAN